MARIRRKCKGKKKPHNPLLPLTKCLGEELQPEPLSEAPGSWREPHSSGQALPPEGALPGFWQMAPTQPDWSGPAEAACCLNNRRFFTFYLAYFDLEWSLLCPYRLIYHDDRHYSTEQLFGVTGRFSFCQCTDKIYHIFYPFLQKRNGSKCGQLNGIWEIGCFQATDNILYNQPMALLPCWDLRLHQHDCLKIIRIL